MSLSNDQYYQVMRIYEKQQQKNRAELNDRRNRIYNAIPALREYEAAIGTANAKVAREAILNGEASLRSKARLADLLEERNMLLASGGFSPADLELSYACPFCKDTGYADGVKCSCFKQREIELLYRESGLGARLESENFDTLSMDLYDNNFPVDEAAGLYLPEYMKRVIDVTKEYARTFSKNSGSLLFTGPAGVGKTFLTHCVAQRLIASGICVVYVTAGELIESLTAQRFSRGGNEDPGALAKGTLIRDCELLIIDDLGTEFNNSMSNTELFSCLDGRLKRGQATLISTNLSMNELRDTYADRIVSRIFGNYRIIRLYGDDLRIRKNLIRST